MLTNDDVYPLSTLPLPETLENIEYFVTNYCHPNESDLSLVNIRLMELDHLLLCAKLSLSKALSRAHMLESRHVELRPQPPPVVQKRQTTAQLLEDI